MLLLHGLSFGGSFKSRGFVVLLCVIFSLMGMSSWFHVAGRARITGIVRCWLCGGCWCVFVLAFSEYGIDSEYQEVGKAVIWRGNVGCV